MLSLIYSYRIIEKYVYVSVVMTSNRKQADIAVELSTRSLHQHSKNANFHFSHYKRLWKLSVAISMKADKKYTLCRGHCHLHVCEVPIIPFMAFKKIFFSKSNPLCCHGNLLNSAIWTKIVEGYFKI